jgi:DNA (cytosine-5)-methyltransferase 1
MIDKPPYRVPSMAEIAALPWNGYSVVSTFSGCGGSCLGFEMTGYRVLWANEFIPAAQEVYRLNHPNVILSTADIRQVQPEEILAAIGKARGEVDVLEGSPPCASFSTAGKREAGWGKVRKYSDTMQRVDDLFFEYARILDGLQPKVFVAENVSGLVKGTAKGYFLEILRALKACGYNVKAQLLDAQWLGVPQMRQRIIFIGVRNDLALEPRFPHPLPYQYTLADAIPWITRVHLGAHGWNDGIEVDAGKSPSTTICQSGMGSYDYHVEAATDISRYAIGREALRIAEGGQSSKYFSLKRAHRWKPCPTITQGLGPGAGPNGETSGATVIHPTELRRFSIAEVKRICAFPDDFQLTGTYAQQWERLGRAVPPVMMAAVARSVQEVLDECRNA